MIDACVHRGENEKCNLRNQHHPSLDGCCDHTKVIPDDEVFEYFTGLTLEAGLQLFGRKTYELMVPYWPDIAKDQSATKADKDFARAFDSINKIVFHDH
jgi:hypothetical protein